MSAEQPAFDFDAERSREARDEGMDKVSRGADPAWSERALEAVRLMALEMPEFAGEDVWPRGLDKPREARAFGPVMLRAVRLGYCRSTDRFRGAKLVTQHASPVRIYESLLYDRKT